MDKEILNAKEVDVNHKSQDLKADLGIISYDRDTEARRYNL